MEPVTVRLCTAQEIYGADNAAALWAEYAAESAIPEIGEHNPQTGMYRAMEDAGLLHTFGAFRGEALVGVLSMLVSMIPHFGRVIASTESFFVREADRKSGAGMVLLKMAEGRARELGAVAFYASSPVGSRLERVLGRVGYRPANTLFVKGLA